MDYATFALDFSTVKSTRLEGERKYCRKWEISLSGIESQWMLLIIHGVTVIVAYLVLNNIPLDYFRLPMEPIQAFYLLSAYLVLALPFFVTGMFISLSFAAYSKSAGLVYFSTMTGSAFGAILPVLLLPLFEEGKLVVVCALIPLFFLLMPSKRNKKPRKLFRNLLWCSGFGVLIIGIFLIRANDGRYVKVI